MEGDSEEEEEESEEGDPEFQAEEDASDDAGASSEDYRWAVQLSAQQHILLAVQLVAVRQSHLSRLPCVRASSLHAIVAESTASLDCSFFQRC